MLPFHANPMTPKELATLQLIARQPITRDIDTGTRKRLLALGYARAVPRGLALTNEGFLQLAPPTHVRDAEIESKQPPARETAFPAGEH